MKVPMLHRRTPINVVEFLCVPPEAAVGWSLHKAR